MWARRVRGRGRAALVELWMRKQVRERALRHPPRMGKEVLSGDELWRAATAVAQAMAVVPRFGACGSRSAPPLRVLLNRVG